MCIVDQRKSHRETVGVRCAARVVHMCLQTAADVLIFDIEVYVVRICMYTVRIRQIKSFPGGHC